MAGGQPRRGDQPVKGYKRERPAVEQLAKYRAEAAKQKRQKLARRGKREQLPAYRPGMARRQPPQDHPAPGGAAPKESP